jgi:hypothetical protein
MRVKQVKAELSKAPATIFKRMAWKKRTEAEA